jgi:hypothetical protein
VCLDGEKQMKDLLLPAIFIFSLLVIGLVLTFLEFRKLEKNKKKD